MTQEEQARAALAERIATRLSIPARAVAELLAEDTELDEICGDYMLCQETIERIRLAQHTGEARAAEYETHAASLEDEILRRVQELRS